MQTFNTFFSNVARAIHRCLSWCTSSSMDQNGHPLGSTLCPTVGFNGLPSLSHTGTGQGERFHHPVHTGLGQRDLFPTLVQARDALEGKGPQRRPQEPVGRRLEEVAKAVGGGYCRH